MLPLLSERKATNISSCFFILRKCGNVQYFAREACRSEEATERFDLLLFRCSSKLDTSWRLHNRYVLTFNAYLFFFSHKATMLPCRKVFKLCKANLLLFIAAPRGFDGALSIGGGGIVKSIGRGRGSVAARFGGGGGGVSALGGLRRPSLAASEVFWNISFIWIILTQ